MAPHRGGHCEWWQAQRSLPTDGVGDAVAAPHVVAGEEPSLGQAQSFETTPQTTGCDRLATPRKTKAHLAHDGAKAPRIEEGHRTTTKSDPWTAWHHQRRPHTCSGSCTQWRNSLLWHPTTCQSASWTIWKAGRIGVLPRKQQQKTKKKKKWGQQTRKPWGRKRSCCCGCRTHH